MTQSSDFPFVKNNLILRVRPIKDVRDLSIIWSVDSTRTLYRNNPCRLIGFLLGSLTFIFFFLCLFYEMHAHLYL